MQALEDMIDVRTALEFDSESRFGLYMPRLTRDQMWFK